MTHTKGKWINQEQKYNVKNQGIYAVATYAPYHLTHIAEIIAHPQRPEEELANAQRIVECVNGYDELKAKAEDFDNLQGQNIELTESLQICSGHNKQLTMEVEVLKKDVKNLSDMLIEAEKKQLKL